jgi:ABC-type dipeptide/oligopeptide/nickel transport system permease component
MLRYVIRRLLMLIPTLFLSSILIFAIIQFAPGDPARMMLGTEATEEQVERERVRLGLDKPVPVRYVVWLSDVARLNLGRSQVNNQPVTHLLADAFPNTLRLALVALTVAILIGFPLGIWAAVRQNRGVDFAVTTFNAVGLAVPSFWLGIILILLFSVRLQWLPPSGIGEPDTFFLFNLPFLVMPVVTIALSNMSVFSRFVRSAMIDVLATDYVRTARAKGLPEHVVVTRHALRTTLLPLVTTVGIQFGALLGGAVVTESVFAYPGIGRLIVRSILNRDYPVVQATLMLVVAIFLITNILVDLSYAYLDPSVKLAASRTG